MNSAATEISSIPTELTHQGTTYQKRLVAPGQYHGNLATMNYAWLTTGSQLTEHTHKDGEEFYFFLEGNGEILVGSTWIPVSKDSFVTIPLQTAHSVRNTSDSNLVFITLRTVQP